MSAPEMFCGSRGDICFKYIDWFYGPDAVGGSVIYVYAKFEADVSIRSKVIRGSQNIEIWSRDHLPT